MACSSHDLQPISLVVHEVQVYVVKYDDLWTKKPGNDIDVYLSPLIEDLRILCEEGIDVDDAYSGEKFKTCAMLFCKINDFHAYGNLARYSAKGHKACHICQSTTYFQQFEFVKEIVYLGHQKFLIHNHPYRKL